MPAKIRRRIAEVAHVITAAAVLLLSRHLAAQARDVGAHARSAARAYRERNEAAIVGEFASLLAIPNLASDSTNIRRNAGHLVQMLERRGFRNSRLLTIPSAPPAV